MAVKTCSGPGSRLAVRRAGSSVKAEVSTVMTLCLMAACKKGKESRRSGSQSMMKKPPSGFVQLTLGWKHSAISAAIRFILSR